MKKLILSLIIIGCIITGFIYRTTIHEKILLTTNPLLSTQELPDFAAIKPKHFVPATDYVINHYNKVLFEQVLTEKSPTWANTVLPLEEALSQIEHVINLIIHLNTISNTAEIRTAYEQILPKITAFFYDIMQNEKLYQAYLNLQKGKEFATYNNAQTAVIKHAIRDAKLAGVNLPPQQKEQFKAIQQQLSKLSNQFSNNVLDATQAWEYYITPENKALLAGLPEHTIAIAQEKAKQKQKSGWILTLDFPCYLAVMSFAKDDDLRKTLYTAYNTRASDQGPMAGKWDNTETINKILTLRQTLASLLGYKNYAEYSLVPRMAKNTKQVMQFLLDLANHSKPFAKEEFAELVKFAKEQHQVTTLNAWDISYYSELYQQAHYKISTEALRAYFPEPQVLSGMFDLAEQLFGIKIKEIPNVNKWHDSVKLFAVTDQTGSLRGKFYTDLYARDFKRSGAWASGLLSRLRNQDGTLQTPVAFLEANFTPATPGSTALLSHEEVIILFHEFGHTLHEILTLIEYPSIAGNNGVAWDAVELPSQLMENWCWEWEVIKKISKHEKTGKSLPKAEFDKLLGIKNYGSALQMIRQLEFSLFDFRIHLNNKDDHSKTVQQILDDIRKQIAVIPVPTFIRQQNSFSHIFDGGYEAGYYSYKWAEVLSSDAFEMFNEHGAFNAEIGKKFLHTILEQGGSQDAMDLFVEFRGRKPTIDALLKHNGLE